VTPNAYDFGKRHKDGRTDMRPAHFPRLDLNLLLVLEALMQERSVTRAAQRLSITQSAVSHSLNRLRHVLNDELLVRGPGEMRPTTRAIELFASTTQALAQLRSAFSPALFDPVTAVRTFRLGMTDYAATFLLEKLSSAVRERAPHVDLKVSLNIVQEAWNLLDSQEIDLLIGMVPKMPDRFESLPLYDDGAAVLMAQHHPLAGRALTLEEYAAAKHVFVPFDGIGTGAIDRMLQRKGLSRRHVLSVNQFALVPPIIRDTDYIVSVPSRLAHSCRAKYRLWATPCPFNYTPITTHMVWHRQLGNHAANRWLQALLQEVSEQLISATESSNS
jgi:DNA-binding transcriptional LysR family regulator